MSPSTKSSLLVVAVCLISTARSTREDLIEGILRLNSDVLHLRNEIESSISDRCNSIRGCYKSSYDECQSEYTSSQTCPSFDQLGYAISDCGSGNKCNGLFDDSITTVRLPANIATGPNGNPTSHEVTEAICYSRSAQRWMVNKYNSDKSFWRSIGVSSPQMYFGSSTGVFRIFPARQSRECGKYDPRLRPWYQASVPATITNSVKPRRVVIMMDTSRSMNETINKKTGETKLSYMKKAAASTISTLSEKASIAVVRFGEGPMLVGRPGSAEPFLWRQATAEHKQRLIEDINAIQVRGRSNWMLAFDFAFDLIRDSLRIIKSQDPPPSCTLENIALLFFSDGEYNLPDGITDEEIVESVSQKAKKVENMGDFQLHTFLYSIGNSNKDQVAKQISCAVDGFWTPATGARTPRNLTNGYQALFSTPMGTPAFYNYTAWSDPYEFSTSSELGYTVSGLVYNRGVEPPRYMGAVGMDISAEAARYLYNGTMEDTLAAMEEITDDIKEAKFSATCEQQRINLTYCETQSVRQLSGGNAAICLPPNVEINKEDLGELTLQDLVTLGEAEIGLNVTDINTPTNKTDDDDEIILIDTTDNDEPTEEEKQEAIFQKLLNCSKGFVSTCPGLDEYPDDMWRNVDLAGQTYMDRVCCQVGTNTVSDECPKLDEIRDTKLSDAAIFGIMFASIVVAELVCCYFCIYYKKRRDAT